MPYICGELPHLDSLLQHLPALDLEPHCFVVQCRQEAGHLCNKWETWNKFSARRWRSEQKTYKLEKNGLTQRQNGHVEN